MHGKYAKADADVLISLTAVELAKKSPVPVVGDDTDLLVLLLHHTSENNNEITLRPQQRSSKMKMWCIQDMKKQLPKSITVNILFMHALLGFDTTSRLQEIGKGSGMKKLGKLKELAFIGKVFIEESSVEEVKNAGEKALLALYSAKEENCLDSLRLTKFIEKYL